MASLITVRLYNSDGTPKTGGNPRLSAIREEDGVKVINSQEMTEVGEGFYKYNFSEYNKQKLYFFYIDDEKYSDINQLDSYGNKNNWGKGSTLILDEEKLAKNVWSLKKKDAKKGTVAEHIFNLKNIEGEESNIEIKKMFDSLFKKSEEIGGVIKKAIAWIKIPPQINDKKLLKNIVVLLKTSMDSYFNNTQKSLETLETTIIENLSTIGKQGDYSFEDKTKELLENIGKLSGEISKLSQKNDELNPENINGEINPDSLQGVINNGITLINKELSEINRKLMIVFSRLNKQ